MRRRILLALACAWPLGERPAAAHPVSPPDHWATGLAQPAGWRDWQDRRAARWEHFYRSRMHWHWEREGEDWAALPMHVKRHVIAREWQEMEASWRD